MDTVGETATEQSAQDIAVRIESVLYGDSKETQSNKGSEVSEDAEKLPKDNDSGSEDAKVSVEGDDLDGSDDDSLAKYLGIDEDNLAEDEDGRIVVKAKIDGQVKLVPFKEVLASYQLQGHVNNKSIALENERKKLGEVIQTETQRLKSEIAEVTAISDVALKQLVGEFESIDWERLRIQDPAEWAAARQEFADRASKLQSLKESLSAKNKLLIEQERQKSEAAFQEHLQAEFQKILVQNPTWSDPAVRERETSELRSFIVDAYGFSESDLDNVHDSRLIAVIKDAMMFRKGQKKVEELKSKPLPKFQKPGRSGASSETLAKARQQKQINANVKATNGSIDSIAQKILNRM